MSFFILIIVILSIEGIPFIIRFKTQTLNLQNIHFQSIEGIPFIIRFKTISY